MSYSSEVLADSPLGYWRPEGSSGTVLSDQSGNGRDADITSSAQLGQPTVMPSGAESLRITGTQFASVNDAAWMDVANLTVEFWFSLDSTAPSAQGLVLRDANSGGNRYFSIYVNSGGRLDGGVWSSGNSALFCQSAAGAIVAGTSYHVALVYTAGADVRLYLNGSLVATTAAAGTALKTGAQPYTFGRASSGAFTTTGYVDEVAVYGTALSAARIAAHYAAASTTAVAGGLISETTTVLAGSVNQVAHGGIVTETTTVLAGVVYEGTSYAAGLVTETTTVLTGVTSTGILVEGGLISETTTVFAGVGSGGQTAAGLITETTTVLSGTTITDYVAGVVDNDADGLHIGGTAIVTWSPNVVPPPNGGGANFDTAIAFQAAPVITGFTPFYEITTQTAPRLRQRIVFGGRDVSFERDVPTIIEDYQYLEPFLYGPASVTFPQILGPFESPSDFGWLRKGKKVRFESVDDTTGEVVSVDYKGSVTTWNPSGKSLRVEIGGEVRGPGSMRPKPLPLFRETRDIGRTIWRMLTNLGVRSRPRLGVTTGIELGQPGGGFYLEALESLLAQATTRAGAQWTVMPDDDGVYRTKRKDRTTVDGTIYLDDARNVADLRSDQAEEPNTIYATGVTPAGMRVNFGAYPGLEQGPAPTFPGNLSEGDSGDDVTVVIRRLEVTRYMNPVDFPGGFDADVVEAVKTLQEDAGLAETGVVNAATWDALWDLNVTGFSSRWSRIMPAAARSYTKPWRLSATGSVIERNPNYDGSRDVVGRMIDVGPNQKQSQIREFAKSLIFDGEEQWTGSIRLTTGAIPAGDHSPGDPITDILRTQHIKAGMNMRLPTLGGLLIHVSGVSHTRDSVTLAVDTRARDMMEVWEVIQRNRESRRDPARAWLRENRSSGTINDSLGDFSEIGGILGQDVYLAGEAWNVIQVVAGSVEGVIRAIKLQTTPHALMAAAVFGKRITAERLTNAVGDPLSAEGAAKWADPDVYASLKDKHVILWSAGSDLDPGGYSPGHKFDEDGELSSAILTGLLEDDGGFNFRTFGQPVLYLAVYADRDTKINAGRIMWPQAQSVI